MLSGSDEPVMPGPEAQKLAAALGFPVIVKASMGGGGRGMRVVESAEELDAALDQARREAGTAFGVPDVFIEKFVRKAKHIEVQILGDQHGNLVHLYERDCSVQRRHQKIVEMAPAYNFDPGVRAGHLRRRRPAGAPGSAMTTRGRSSSWWTWRRGAFYFIEVNPRIQVEHTVTEIVTNVDLIKSQILIAAGRPLSDPEIELPSQDVGAGSGLRPAMPGDDRRSREQVHAGLRADHALSLGRRAGHPDRRRPGRHRRNHHAVLRLAAGQDLCIGPPVHRRRPANEAVLEEFRVRGVKTNIPFLLNLVANPEFLAGNCTTRFVDENPDLFRFPVRQNRAMRLLTYAAEITVNGFPGVARPPGHAVDARAGSTQASSRGRRRTVSDSSSWRWAPTPSRAGCASKSRCS